MRSLPVELKPGARCRWELVDTSTGGGASCAAVVASEERAIELGCDPVLAQLVELAALPGVEHVLAQPNLYRSHGFPVGTLTVADRARAWIHPVGLGSDLGAGTRILVVSGLKPKKVRQHRGELAKALADAIPAGRRATGPLKLLAHEIDQVCLGGASWPVHRKLGEKADLAACTPEGGLVPDATPASISADARIQGAPQLGTLGGSGHGLQVAVIETCYDELAAAAWGLRPSDLIVILTTGARSLGEQVVADEGNRLKPDWRQTRALLGTPLDTDEGQRLLGVGRALSNFALANRQVITHRVREVLEARFGSRAQVRVLCDLEHTGFELENVPGYAAPQLVHRRGLTRGGPHAFPLVGDLGQASYLLRADSSSDGLLGLGLPTTPGRLLSRNHARQSVEGRDVAREIARDGVSLQVRRRRTLEEEHPGAHRDPTDVVATLEDAHLARPVLALAPIAIVKG